MKNQKVEQNIPNTHKTTYVALVEGRVVLLEIRAGVLVLILDWEQLWALLPLEALAHSLVLFCKSEVRHQQVKPLFEVLLGGWRITCVPMQISVRLVLGSLALPHLVVQLVLTVVDKAVGRKAVGVEASRQILPSYFLPGGVIVMRQHGQLVVKGSPWVSVLKVESRARPVIEGRRFGRVLVVVVA